ncbi:hypothetical protein GCM10007978_40660 [Shewanella hanedai]|uniref:Outer membrane beta-barrel protein n=1 Tax=Shewanella hanedai TaxID=25 RepID=A0A553JML2_SHEHA|nr:outer membrane beta-barrel protein [Shewanella hanedai]TRY13694.1 outer membrane beta-barrel protein [Shewanella hanedai]GGI98721.1 hypothetical protein GCM10007978_40660 [Shewanella hanedai]
MILTPLSRAVTAALCGLSFSGAALAIEPAGHTTESGVVITPLLDTGLKYDDNIFSQSNNETSSSIYTLAPSVNFLLDDGVNQYQLDAAFESGTYLDSSDDNYLTGNLAASTHLEASSSSRFDVSLMANWDSEERGTGLSEGTGDSITEPLTFVEQTVAATYEYGAMSSSARVAFDAKYYNKDYTNYAEITEFNNYDSLYLGSTFFYTTNASTDAFIELSRDAIRYDKLKTNTVSRDSDDYFALAGVTWEATALTSGSVKLGYQHKAFTSSGREDFSGLSWNAEVTWQPLTYSSFMLTTSRMARDPNTEGDYIDATLYGVNWTHDWSEMVSTNLGANYTQEDYKGNTNRQDETFSLNASVDVELRRWLGVSLYVSMTDKDSNRDNIAYDKSIIGVNFTASL